MITMRLATTLTLGVFASCTKPTPEPPGSCYRDRDSVCIEYDATKAAAGRRLCTGFHWTNGSASCPTAARLGTCTREGAIEILYGGPPNNYDATAAEHVCTKNGGSFALAK